MSQGRSNLRQPRAPAAALRRHFPTQSPVAGPENGSFRIGPADLRSAAEWHERGIQHEQIGDYEQAIRCYRSALAIEPASTQILFDLAYTLAQSGKLDAAIERYRQITEIEPRRQDAWVNLGDLLLSTGCLDDGLAALRRAVQLDPSDPVARHNLAIAVSV